MKNSGPEIDNILKVLKEKQRFLITSHKDPDGDSIGSQLGLYLALAAKGKEVAIVNQGGMPGKYDFLDKEGLIRFTPDPPPFIPDVVIILECPQRDRIGFVESLIPQSAIILNIDHHLGNENYGDIKFIDPKACAVAELLFFILLKGEYPITPPIAEKLYTAIMTDTGNFRFASTSEQGMKVAAELIGAGANPKMIFDNVYGKAAAATIKLLGKTLDTLRLTPNGNIGFMAVTQENINRAGARIEDSEGFVDYSIAVIGVKMGLLFKEMNPDEIKISVRSQNGIDAAGFARLFDGGGHINAAGFTVRKRLDDAIRMVLARAEEYLHAA